MKLSPKKGVHVIPVAANLQLNIAAKKLNTVAKKSNLRIRNSFNLQ